MIKSTLFDFYQFIKKPNDVQFDLDFRNKLRFTLILFVFEFIITFIIILPILVMINDVLDLTRAVDTNKLSILQKFFFLVIIMPFIEELIFRYFLRYEGTKTDFISHHQWNKIFPFLVYSFGLCFGFIHLTNFSNTNNWFYILSPLVVIFQLVGGFIITYIRVRISFLWGVYYHWAMNFFFIVAIPTVESFFDKA